MCCSSGRGDPAGHSAKTVEAFADGPAIAGALGSLHQGQGRNLCPYQHSRSALAYRRGQRQEAGAAQLHRPSLEANPICDVPQEDVSLPERIFNPNYEREVLPRNSTCRQNIERLSLRQHVEKRGCLGRHGIPHFSVMDVARRPENIHTALRDTQMLDFRPWKRWRLTAEPRRKRHCWPETAHLPLKVRAVQGARGGILLSCKAQRLPPWWHLCGKVQVLDLGSGVLRTYKRTLDLGGQDDHEHSGVLLERTR